MKKHMLILLAIILSPAVYTTIRAQGCTETITNVETITATDYGVICQTAGDKEFRFTGGVTNVAGIMLKNCRVKVYAANAIRIGRVYLDNATLLVFGEGEVGFFNNSTANCTDPNGFSLVPYDIDVHNNSRFTVAAKGKVGTRSFNVFGNITYARRIGVTGNSKFKIFSCGNIDMYCDRMNVGYCYYSGNANPTHSCETYDLQSATDKSYVELLCAGKMAFLRGDFYRRSTAKFISHGTDIAFGDFGLDYSVRFPVTQVPPGNDLEGVVWLSKNTIQLTTPGVGNSVGLQYEFAGVNLGDLWAWGRLMLNGTLRTDFYCPAICSSYGQVNWNFDVGPPDPFRNAGATVVNELKPAAQNTNGDIMISAIPNPASGKFTLRFASSGRLPENAELQVVSLNGQPLLTRRLTVPANTQTLEETIDATTWTAGIYMLNIHLPGHQPQTLKLVVSKN